MKNNKIILIMVALIVVIVSVIFISNVMFVGGNAKQIIDDKSIEKYSIIDNKNKEGLSSYTLKTENKINRDPAEIWYSDDIFSISYDTNHQMLPIIDGIIEDWEKNSATKKLNIPHENEENTLLENFYIKLVDNKIYFGVELIGDYLSDDFDCNIDYFNYTTSFQVFFDEGNNTDYGSGNLDYISTPQQEDLKSIFKDPNYNNGDVFLADQYLFDCSQEGSSTFCWFYGRNNAGNDLYNEQINFEGDVSTHVSNNQCIMSGEMLIPLEGEDGVYINTENDDQSDLNLGSNYGIIGMKYFFSPNDFGSSTYSTYSGYFKLEINQFAIANIGNDNNTSSFK